MISQTHSYRLIPRSLYRRLQLRLQLKEKVMTKNEWQALDSSTRQIILFVLIALRVLENKRYKYVHTVYSGFNQIFRETFNEDPVKAVHAVASYGLAYVGAARGGAILGKGQSRLEFTETTGMAELINEYEGVLMEFRDRRSLCKKEKSLPKPIARKIKRLADVLWDAGYHEMAVKLLDLM